MFYLNKTAPPIMSKPIQNQPLTLKNTFKYIIILCASFLLLNPNAFAINSELLVQPSQLQSNKTHNTVILDVRSLNKYQEGHIPGAVHLDVNTTFNTNFPDKVGGIRQIEALFQAAGLNHHMTIVAYDDGEFINAGRMFWVLELFGLKKVAVLDGGLPLWRKNGFSISTKIEKPTPSTYRAAINSKILGTKQDAHIAALKQTSVLLDGRAKDMYDAEHIPSSINIPWNQNYDSSNDINTLKSPENLSQIYSDLPQDKNIMTYCHKGKQSSFSYFVLRYLGHDAIHYDGSWYEWKQDPRLPKTNNNAAMN